MPDRDRPQVETATEVRQGPKGKPVLRVLIRGLILGVLALFYFMTTSVENPPVPGTDAVAPQPQSSEPPPPAEKGPY